MKRAILDRLHVMVHGAKPPTVTEWDDYLDTVEAQGPGLVELILTAGAGPSWSQRKALRTLLAGRRVPTAILTDHKLTRFKLGCYAFFERAWEVRAFPAGALSDALAHLGILASRASLVDREIAELRHEHPEAKHCAACGTVGARMCPCECLDCALPCALLLQARRDTESPEDRALGDALERFERSLTLPKDAEERILKVVLERVRKGPAR
jgi:hypothetical protein